MQGLHYGYAGFAKLCLFMIHKLGELNGQTDFACLSAQTSGFGNARGLHRLWLWQLLNATVALSH